MPFCDKCGDHMPRWAGDHVCLPEWEVCECSEDDTPETIIDAHWQESRIVHASDADDAAQEYCNIVDREGDYEFARAGSADLAVRPKDGTAVSRFIVEVRTETNYYARAKV